MEENPAQLLAVNRSNIKSTLSADKLLSLLLAAKLLDQDEVVACQAMPTEIRADFLLDTIQGRNKDSLRSFLAVLAAHYPQLRSPNPRGTETTTASSGKSRYGPKLFVAGNDGVVISS